MARAFSEIAFTPSVLAKQEARGSAQAYAKFLTPEADPANRITTAEAAFIQARDGFYQATVSETGWPYVQFRGGPRGFLRVLDERTIAYADFRGNRQFLSTGNLSRDDRVALILMDYPNQRRLKVLGRARVVTAEEEPELVAGLMPEGYHARPEGAVVIAIEGLDWNCPAHIPQRLSADEIMPLITPLKAEIEALKARNAALEARVSGRD